jgi:kynureninase
MKFTTSINHAQNLDQEDPLRSFREQFYIPQSNNKEVVYFCGNSLGLLPKNTEYYIKKELDTWAKLGVEGHFNSENPWLHYHKFVQEQLAEVVGAKPYEVIAANSLTVNLHLMFASFYQPAGKKTKIMVEHNPFSSDWYAIQSQIQQRGLSPDETLVELQPDEGNSYISTQHILNEIDRLQDELALIFLGGVNYLTGQAFDMKTIIEYAHKKNIMVGLDLAHAVGNLELKLHDWQADFAVWCSYKYLNSGPGGTGGYFIHEKHAANTNMTRLAGWWGQEESTRFQMGKEFNPTPTAEGWQLSNAPVLSLAAQWASLDIIQQAGISNMRAKSKKLTAYLEFLLNDIIISKENPYQISIITPTNPEERGCQLSLKITSRGKELYEKLKDSNFIVDFRNPDIIRVSPAPLYNTFEDVFSLVNFLQKQY